LPKIHFSEIAGVEKITGLHYQAKERLEVYREFAGEWISF